MEIDVTEILYKEEVYKIQGAIFEVYKELGFGFLESVYQEALEIELNYKNHKLNHIYKADLICFDSIIIEIKAVKKIADEHRAQILNYMKASGLKLGLIVNFGHYPKVEIDRKVL